MNPKKNRKKNRRRAHKLADQAWEAADEGHYGLAAKIIQRAIKANMGNPVLWNDQGIFLRELGDDERAVESFQSAISLAPEFAEAYARLAEIQSRRHQFHDAVVLQEYAVKHAPQSKSYHETLDAYRALANHAGAVLETVEPERWRMVDGICSIEHALRDELPTLANAVDNADWGNAQAKLTGEGCVLMREVLGHDFCHQIRVMFHDDASFAQTVVMNKKRFGRGVYRYFDSPLPKLVDAARRMVYPQVAAIANHWQELLCEDDRFPTSWEPFRISCAQAGQTTPTPLLLRYEAGGFNAPHRDIRGDVFFPIQMAIVLSPQAESLANSEIGFSGGEFIFCDQPERKASDRRHVPAGLGDAVLFCTRSRLQRVAGIYGLKPVKHGVERILSGQRYVLGIPFHEYR